MRRILASTILVAAVFAQSVSSAAAQDVRNTSYVTKSGERVLRIETVVPATTESVWKAWTDSQELSKWIAPVVAIVSQAAPAVDTAREQVVKIVTQIQRADYEGDRTALNHLYNELVPFVDEPELASRVRYWRGFAKWRRAINGFGETPTPKDLSDDLTNAESEFDAAIQRDPGFVDAKVGAASCMFNRFFLEGVFKNQKDPQRLREILTPASMLLTEAKTTSPDNPRLLWVVGPNLWSTPPDRGGGQEKAIATYEKGLDAIRQHKEGTNDPLEPTWGEPELLMSLAWSNLSRTTPDLKAAEQYAQAALKLVPYWHYVRDVLMAQIRSAQAKTR